MCLFDPEMVKHAADIFDRLRLGIHGRILWYIGRRIAAGIERNRAVAAAEETDLRPPTRDFTRKLMDEDHGHPASDLFVVEIDTIYQRVCHRLNPRPTHGPIRGISSSVTRAAPDLLYLTGTLQRYHQ